VGGGFILFLPLTEFPLTILLQRRAGRWHRPEGLSLPHYYIIIIHDKLQVISLGVEHLNNDVRKKERVISPLLPCISTPASGTPMNFEKSSAGALVRGDNGAVN